MSAARSASNDARCTACLALGSNLGDRRAIIQSAIASLGATHDIAVLAVSSIIETAPVGPAVQGRYLNAAVKIETSLGPQELLATCLAIEASHGRDRATSVRWGPRRLDIDILLFGERVIDEPGLRVPHPHMADRLFVLQPLAEIAPEIIHPVAGLTIRAMLDRMARGVPKEYSRDSTCSQR